MSLLDKQNEFVKSTARFFTWLEVNGYQISYGEAFRPLWVAKQYASQGTGIERTNHTERLAIDLNIFKRGVLMLTVEDLKPAGEYWESLSVPNLEHTWGGRFSVPDANHFSFEHNGIR